MVVFYNDNHEYNDNLIAMSHDVKINFVFYA